MEAIQLSHPTQEKLSSFNNGKLGVTESAEIEQHLAECDDCCQLLKTLPNDTLVVLLSPETGTKADGAGSCATAQPEIRRHNLDVTIAPGAVHTQAGTPSPAVPAHVPAELLKHPRYRIIALLGRGGMGSVYQAEHRLMNREVALKVIDRRLVQTPGLVERFHREVQAAAKLSHPNIVTAFDAEQAGNLHFLVMELVKGHDLAQIVAERGKLPVHEACDYVRQAAQGLQHAFVRGMVHRDIKPQNLMLTSEGQVKILDFGLAQFVTEIAEESGLTMVGSIMGTPDYMAPEQARDAHSADIRADIYSLGCTLYCLLSGNAPFPTGSSVEKIINHLQNEPAPLAELRADISPELAGVLKKMTAKLPADRYQTPAEVVNALAPFAQKVGLSHAPSLRANRPTRSPRVLVAIAAAAFAALAALAAVIFVTTDKGRIEIQSEVDDVDVAIKQGGKEITIIDAQTGSQVKWLPSGTYEVELKGERNDIELTREGFTLTRFGKQIVMLKRKSSGSDLVADWMAGKLKVESLQKFDAKEPTISQDGVTAAVGAWKIDATEPRTARLFEVASPDLEECIVLYRAKLKTENLKGRAFLEMWVRAPGGEFFSKGFDKAVTGTTGWSEYEIPFILQKGQPADLVKLNVTIEGTGTIWIKDIELRRAGRQPSVSPKTPDELPLKEMSEFRRFEGHEGPVRALAWMPTGKTLLSGSGFPNGDKTLRLWDSSTGLEVRQLNGHSGQVYAIDVNRDGDRALAACDDHSIHLWNLETGEHVREFRGHTQDPTTVIFVPDGRHALSASHDKTVKLWDLEAGTVTREFTGHTALTFGLAVLPGNRQFLSGSWDGTIRLWDMETGENLRTFAGHERAVWLVKALPDGSRFLSGGDDGSVRMWEVSSAKELSRFSGHSRQVFALDVSADGRFAASGGGDGLVCLWDIKTGKQLSLARQQEFVWAVAFSPDGKSLLSAGGGKWKSENWDRGEDFLIRLWNLPGQSQNLEKSAETNADQDWKGWPADFPPAAIAPFNAEQAKQLQEAWAKHLGVPVQHTNSIGMKFRLMPPGEFMMGSTPENVKLVRQTLKQYWPDEAQSWEDFLQSGLPQHKVILTEPIYLGVHEVTQAQYEKVMGQNPSHFSATGDGKEIVVGMDTASFPVEMVNWHDAVDFCAKLSQQEKLHESKGTPSAVYRLPTEAEWEYACRAGTTTRFSFGDRFQDLEKVGWVGGMRTNAVGQLQPNPYALYDVHGNVGEWVEDIWDLKYYTEFKDKPALDPPGASSTDFQRVVRGGFWHSTWIPCQSSSRSAGGPFHRHKHSGMRVALSVDFVLALEKPLGK